MAKSIIKKTANIKSFTVWNHSQGYDEIALNTGVLYFVTCAFVTRYSQVTIVYDSAWKIWGTNDGLTIVDGKLRIPKYYRVLMVMAPV